MPAPDKASERRRRLREIVDRTPTHRLVTAATALLLLSTAAFGGLGTAKAVPLPEVESGNPVVGAQLTIQIDRAILVDELPEQYLEPQPGGRLLVVTATVENTWHSPVPTLAGVGAADNLRPAGVDGLAATTPPLAVVLLVDGTLSPELQPGVPMELGYVWEVDADALVADDRLAVTLFDKVYRADGFVTHGERFQEPFVAARVWVTVEDTGTDGKK